MSAKCKHKNLLKLYKSQGGSLEKVYYKSMNDIQCDILLTMAFSQFAKHIILSNMQQTVLYHMIHTDFTNSHSLAIEYWIISLRLQLLSLYISAVPCKYKAHHLHTDCQNKWICFVTE